MENLTPDTSKVAVVHSWNVLKWGHLPRNQNRSYQNISTETSPSRKTYVWVQRITMAEVKTPSATTQRQAPERGLSSPVLTTNCCVPAHLPGKRLFLWHVFSIRGHPPRDLASVERRRHPRRIRFRQCACFPHSQPTIREIERPSLAAACDPA